MTQSSWIAMAATVLAFAAVLAYALASRAKHGQRLAEFARQRGYPFTSGDERGLGSRLETSLPDYRYLLTNLMTISLPGARAYAGDCEYLLKRQRGRASFDRCFVIERDRPFAAAPVDIFPRARAADALIANSLAIGSPAFQERWRVSSKQISLGRRIVAAFSAE